MAGVFRQGTGMKQKALLLILLFVFVGCASAPKTKETIPPETAKRIGPIVMPVMDCMDCRVKVKIADSKEPNAFMDSEGSIIFTLGIFPPFDDETLKFVTAHEIAHHKLGHISKAWGVSIATTGAMMILNVFVPGAGLLNHAVNPAVVNNYTKTQELEADRMASDVSEKCLKISKERQIEILIAMKNKLRDAGGFWDRHPSWDERIQNIKRTSK
jgi:Zn-dependent protease with chaperone function